jgi:hypothetical protein
VRVQVCLVLSLGLLSSVVSGEVCGSRGLLPRFRQLLSSGMQVQG